MNIKSNIDHLVIVSATLEEGVAYVEESLGVPIPPGGQHERMGTHNHVMSLGNGIYLEVIAINPNMPAPNRPRWFGLDDPFVNACLKQGPRLLTWVVNTTDIRQAAKQSSVYPGKVESMSRGQLEWLITIPEDGGLNGSGLIPTIIQWDSGVHPTSKMKPSGCTLTRLTLHHSNPRWLEQSLKSTGVESIADISDILEIQPLPPNTPPYITAQIQTPSGIKEI